MSIAAARALRRPAAAIAAALLAVLVVFAIFQPHHALQAWYAATVFWTGISLGGLALLMIHHLTSGRWGWYLRPLLKPVAAALPVALLAHVPLLTAMDVLFPWTQPAAELPDVVQRKVAYLNEPFFLIRAAIYAGVWLTLAWLLTASGRSTGERRYGLAAGGLILYALTVTFYGVDWVQSLEPTFYSSAIGYVMATGQFVSVLAFAIVAAALFLPAQHEGAQAPYHDLGNLLLAAVMLWTYIVFAKYLIIWIADLPHEIEWYVHRQEGAWYWLTLLLIALHFCLPLVLLLFRRIKQSRVMLAAVAALLLVAHALDVSWLVLPSFGPRPAYAGLVDVLALMVLGCLWLLAFLSRLRLPDVAPRVEATTVEADG